MLRLLSSNQPIAFMLTVFTVLIGGILAFVFNAEDAVITWNADWVNSFFSLSAGRIIYWVTGLLAGAWSIHHVYNRHEFIEDHSALASWIYVMLWITFSLDEITHPLLWANVPLIWSINWIFSVYRQNDAKDRYFNAGILLGVSTLICTDLLWFGPVLFVCIAYTRSFKWREWWLALAGLMLPWLIYLSLNWTLNPSFLSQFELAFDLPCPAKFQGVQWAGIILLGLATLIGIQRLFASFNGSSNKARNTRSVFIIMFLGAIISGYPIWQSCETGLFISLILLLSFLLPLAFKLKKRPWLIQLLFLTIVLSMLFRIWTVFA